MDEKQKLLEYLKDAGVNKDLLKFADKYPAILLKAKNVLGENFKGPMTLSNSDDEKCAKLLRDGYPEFKITADGNVWYKENKDLQQNREDNTRIRLAGQHFYNRAMSLKNNNEISSEKGTYLQYDKGKISEKSVESIKCQDENLMNEKDYYKICLTENVYDKDNLSLLEKTTAMSSLNSTNDMPNKELDCNIQKFNKFSLSDIINEQRQFNTSEWNFVKDGNNQLVQEQDTGSTKIKGFFDKLFRREQDTKKDTKQDTASTKIKGFFDKLFRREQDTKQDIKQDTKQDKVTMSQREKFISSLRNCGEKSSNNFPAKSQGNTIEKLIKESKIKESHSR